MRSDLGRLRTGCPAHCRSMASYGTLIGRLRQAREYQTQDGGVGLSAYVFHRNGKPLKNTFGKQWRRACIKAGLGRRVENEKGALVYIGKHFHDFGRTAARNMIRGGVPQSVAMRVTGHETDAMFQRYDITDSRDKLEALEAARRFADQQPGLAPNLALI